MQRHPIAATWGRSDLASSDLMSMETIKRVWQARLDPRRNTPSIGIYSHVKDRWGIFHAQPFVLNERQAGVAIEGVIRQEKGLRHVADASLPLGDEATLQFLAINQDASFGRIQQSLFCPNPGRSLFLQLV